MLLIGHIEDDDLRKLLVTTYTKAKGLVDMLRFNNALVETYNNSQTTYQLAQADAYKLKAENEYAALVRYAVTLREFQRSVKPDVELLKRELRKAVR